MAGCDTFMFISRPNPDAPETESDFSRSLMICERPNTPIRMGKNGNPVLRNSHPKVRRGMAIRGSVPNEVIKRPKALAINPLTRDCSERLATTDRVRMKSEKYSQGRNSGPGKRAGSPRR